MGGSIGFTVRQEDGTEHRMCRWTNSMDSLIKNLKFYTKSGDHLKEYLKTWYDMVKDYDDAKKGIRPLPKITMVDVYAPNPFLAPMNYGLVVVDYITNNVLNLQGYTDLEKFDFNVVGYDILHSDNDEDYLYFKELCENKRVIGIINNEPDPHNDKTIISVTTERIFTFEESKKFLKEEKRSMYGTFFKVDTSPWTFTRYPKTKEGIIEFRKKVLELGFVLTDEEKTMWDEYESQYEEKEVEKES